MTEPEVGRQDGLRLFDHRTKLISSQEFEDYLPRSRCESLRDSTRTLFALSSFDQRNRLFHRGASDRIKGREN